MTDKTLLPTEIVSTAPDGNAEFTEGMGLLVEKKELGFGKRSWRYSMLVKNGVIEKMFIEEEKPGDHLVYPMPTPCLTTSTPMPRRRHPSAY